MTDRLVTTDEALEALFDELASLQSTSRQLADAGNSVGQALEASENIAKLSSQLIVDSETQLNETRALAVNTVDMLGKAIAAQESSSQNIQHYLASDLQPQMVDIRDIAVDVSEQLGKAIDAQETFASDMQTFLQSELRRQMEENQRATTIDRWLLIATLIAALGNLGFFIWSVWA